jgi:hypothetical protein
VHAGGPASKHAGPQGRNPSTSFQNISQATAVFKHAPPAPSRLNPPSPSGAGSGRSQGAGEGRRPPAFRSASVVQRPCPVSWPFHSSDTPSQAKLYSRLLTARWARLSLLSSGRAFLQTSRQSHGIARSRSGAYRERETAALCCSNLDCEPPALAYGRGGPVRIELVPSLTRDR